MTKPIKPSDAVAWSECARRVWLDNFPEQLGDFELVEQDDAFEQLVIDLGLKHERSVVHSLSEDKVVVTAQSAEHTQQLMTEGVDVIYQAQLVDEYEGFIGFPDFLIRGKDGEYQAADAKLALSEDKKAIQVQLGFYRRMLGNDHPAIVFLGDGSTGDIGDESNKLTNQFVTEMRSLLNTSTEPAVRYGHSKCRACPYYDYCKPKFEESEDLSLLYGVQGRAADGLVKVGIHTITALANANAEKLPDVPYLKGAEKKYKAILQAQSYFDESIHQIAPIELPEGTWVHFDIESNPLTESGEAHVYLWGFLVPPFDNGAFEYIWTDTETDDRDGWLRFLAKIEDFRSRYPDLILAHYTSYEVSSIRAYAKRYGMEDNSTVEYLLGEETPLFDIQKPVLKSLVLPLQGYGLKDICKHPKLVNFQWEDDSSGSQWSVVQFYNFLTESDPRKKQALKDQILGYNRDDVIATKRLEEWLRSF